MLIDEFELAIGISKSDILGKRRYSEIVTARHLYWKFLLESGLSYNYIAKTHNVANHSVIYHGVKHINELLSIGDVLAMKFYSKAKHLKYYLRQEIQELTGE